MKSKTSGNAGHPVVQVSRCTNRISPLSNTDSIATKVMSASNLSTSTVCTSDAVMTTTYYRNYFLLHTTGNISLISTATINASSDVSSFVCRKKQ